MLKKRKETPKDDLTVPSPPSSERGHIPHSLSQEGTSGGKTIIGQHIAIEGSIRGKENLLIEGALKGSIDLAEHQVTVGPKGQVEAEIHAKDVTISGRMVGNIIAIGSVRMTKEAEFKGEVKAKRISVEDGAFIKAVIELERDDPKKAASIGKPDFKTGASTTEAKPTSLSGGADKGK